MRSCCCASRPQACLTYDGTLNIDMSGGNHTFTAPIPGDRRGGRRQKRRWDAGAQKRALLKYNREPSPRAAVNAGTRNGRNRR
jgi:hypothetical protein